ncbi:FtsK/SpoIIIE domain-containing protein [Microbacterium sp. SS28]|uniref:FtsK/SpoIIIE domain-containing protein n=1 Tax=Microbacterium sp. SS28 TaxID=2919948 RepID=UPI001FA9E99E|nr:FtsK/SpoIIIE domain-containing protein [Microbacterium sp. SS28]
MSPIAPPPLHADPDDLLDEPLALPAEPTTAARAPVPVLAMIVPLAGAVVLWLVTGSALSLWLALLGPLLAGASFLDGRRAARRERRRATAETDAAHARIATAIDARHDRERARRREQHPDVASFLASTGEIWRPVPTRGLGLVVGTGAVPSAMQVSGGGADERSTALRRRARIVSDAPVVIPASGGIAVAGPPALAAAVVRALVLQACLVHPPGELRILGTLGDEDRWVERLPHRRATTGIALAVVGAGAAVPADAEMAIVRADPAARTPPPCAAHLTVDSPGRARLDAGGDVREVAIEGVSLAQAEEIARRLATLAEALPGHGAIDQPAVLFAALPPGSHAAGLSAVIGLDDGAPAVVDLVADGPHAVVAGMTGSGKSELLVTWVLALCASRSAREVSFLLADFKGGTAFDALAGLPHVTGVITDLDGAGARRAIESLRAEVRWREGELARCGARDILDPRVDLPRLVVVVDEFAALLGDHPELHAVFTDIAARGRALGMHLVLGTQRVAGVVRDALLANCPLRVSLRVADTADSRAVVGTDDAARLPGGAAGRGLALVRRSGDPAPRRVRIALSTRDDIAAIAATADDHRPRRPWLPDLPRRIELAELARGDLPSDELVLGLADEPERQRQVAIGIAARDRGVLVVGAAGMGKSTALRTLAAQAAAPIILPSDPEGAWDAVAALAESPGPRGTVVVIDDLDALAARFPHEYAAELLERLERVVRGAGDSGLLVLASAQRLTGGAARIAELLPRRVLLGAPTRAEYIAAGGEAAHHAPGQPPGRARLDGRALQIAVEHGRASAPAHADAPWTPGEGLTGFVARRSAAARAALAEWERQGIRIVPVAEASLDQPVGGVVLAGDAEDWQRSWQLLTGIRNDHALVIDQSVAADFRALSADRTLPPYCAPGRARAWLCRDGLPAARITLPGGEAGRIA